MFGEREKERRKKGWIFKDKVLPLSSLLPFRSAFEIFGKKCWWCLLFGEKVNMDWNTTAHVSCPPWILGIWLSLEMWVLAVTRGQSGDVGVGVGCHPGAVWRCGCWLSPRGSLEMLVLAVWRCGCWLSPRGSLEMWDWCWLSSRGSLEMWVLAVTRGQSGDVAVGCHPGAVWRCGIGVSGHPGADLKGPQSEEALHALLIKNGVKNIHSTLCVDLWSSLCKSWHLKVGKTSFFNPKQCWRVWHN